MLLIQRDSKFTVISNFIHSIEISVSNFNNRPGWNGGGHAGTGAAVRNAYLQRGDFNVFTVDWGIGAGTPNYILARNRVNEAGHVVAQFIDFLNVNGMPFNRILISGHSLGKIRFFSEFRVKYD